ncbi:hypothetical protein [Candidatus Marimicrobium litorale]|uniref:Uncharacterized protein n=1 Tax=Candidatus Marimicrobium litorale TaxID=2518991 RepID=A0ABT3T222_9GAMM|nr:hypothetical protein [Candidatus Marimicrobium litorale]MCX2975886.1 hypothetical protein [Candidatus Marimicrobium litorale]
MLLIILGTMGFMAILGSTYVFIMAARNYVSDDQTPFLNKSQAINRRLRVERNPADRRNGRQVTFPLTVNGILIPNDRRFMSDRRLAAA